MKKFKTTINCGSCVNTVKFFFDKEEKIKDWKVDTENPDKILEIDTELSENEVIEPLKAPPYEATPA